MVITYSRVWINRVRLPILLVVSSTGKINIPLSPCVPENLVSRDGFSRPVPRQHAHLHTQNESGAYIVTVWINRVRLPTLHVVRCTRKMNISLSPFAPENLVSRDVFGSPIPHQPAHLHTQAESDVRFRDSSQDLRRREYNKLFPIRHHRSLGYKAKFWRNVKLRRHRLSVVFYGLSPLWSSPSKVFFCFFFRLTAIRCVKACNWHTLYKSCNSRGELMMLGKYYFDPRSVCCLLIGVVFSAPNPASIPNFSIMLAAEISHAE